MFANHAPKSEQASITIQRDRNHIECCGVWTVDSITLLPKKLSNLDWSHTQSLTIDGSAITTLDSAGAWLLFGIIQHIQQHDGKINLVGFSKPHHELLDLLQHHAKKSQQTLTQTPSWLERINARIHYRIMRSGAIFGFIGETSYYLWRTLCRPTRLHIRELTNIIQQSGYCALPIVGLLAFLVGVILTYQMGLQLKNYGANIYVVDLLGLAVLREFGPLTAAIIVAGRTGAAFTAEIGTMKVNEEIDALTTLGISPFEILTLPRLLGLMIAFPLLTIWANIFGVLGGMTMASGLLNIDMYNFLQRFHEVISFRTYYLGMIKAPVFALLIACVGCYRGFCVSGGADSVGRETTKSVVHAIFLIIIADAIYSVICGWQNV